MRRGSATIALRHDIGTFDGTGTVILNLHKIWRYELFNPGSEHAVDVGEIILTLGLLVVGLIGATLFARFVGRRLQRRKVSVTAAAIAEKVLFYTLLLAVLSTALHLLGIPLTTFAFLGGGVAIGVGFGAQNIIGNFIGGWILIAERPVRIGDVVEVENNLGRVAAIGARSTRIRRTDGIEMLVPNSVMLERTVTNWTLIDQRIRTSVRVGVCYGSPTETVERLIRDAVESQEDILDDPAPTIIFEEFGDNALIFDVYFWCNVESEMDLRLVRSAVRFAIDRMFRDADIIIAYPQRDLHLDTLQPLEVRMVDGPNTPPPTDTQ